MVYIFNFQRAVMLGLVYRRRQLLCAFSPGLFVCTLLTVSSSVLVCLQCSLPAHRWTSTATTGSVSVAPGFAMETTTAKTTQTSKTAVSTDPLQQQHAQRVAFAYCEIHD